MQHIVGFQGFQMEIFTYRMLKHGEIQQSILIPISLEFLSAKE